MKKELYICDICGREDFQYMEMVEVRIGIMKGHDFYSQTNQGQYKERVFRAMACKACHDSIASSIFTTIQTIKRAKMVKVVEGGCEDA